MPKPRTTKQVQKDFTVTPWNTKQKESERIPESSDIAIDVVPLVQSPKPSGQQQTNVQRAESRRSPGLPSAWSPQPAAPSSGWITRGKSSDSKRPKTEQHQDGQELGPGETVSPKEAQHGSEPSTSSANSQAHAGTTSALAKGMENDAKCPASGQQGDGRVLSGLFTLHAHVEEEHKDVRPSSGAARPCQQQPFDEDFDVPEEDAADDTEDPNAQQQHQAENEAGQGRGQTQQHEDLEEADAPDHTHITGPCQLVLLPHGSFSGHLIDSRSRACYGLVGREVSGTADAVQEAGCLWDDNMSVVEVTLINYATREELRLAATRSGGDMAHLVGPPDEWVLRTFLGLSPDSPELEALRATQLSFEADVLHDGEAAAVLVAKFFPALAARVAAQGSQAGDVVVNVGRGSVTGLPHAFVHG